MKLHNCYLIIFICLLILYEQVSPTWSVGYDSSDDNSNSKSKRKDISIDLKSVKSSDKCRIPMSVKCHEQPLDPPGVFSWADDEKMTETKISWNSLPPALVDLGKVQCFT